MPVSCTARLRKVSSGAPCVTPLLRCTGSSCWPSTADSRDCFINGVRLTPRFRHAAALDMPSLSAARMDSNLSSVMVGGRPPTRPRRRAAASPAVTRSLVKARSYWASAPKTWNSSSPDAVVVSIPSVSDRKATCLSFSVFTMESRCGNERPSRSSFHTTSTSPGRTNSSAFVNAFRSIILCSGRTILEQVPDIDTCSLQRTALDVGVLAVRLGRNSHVPDKHVRKTYEM